MMANEMAGRLEIADAMGPGHVPTVSVVIPTLNEEENLPTVLPRIPLWVDEIILVDGRSVDQTIAVARNLVPDIIVIHEPRAGKGAALRAGFLAAQGDIIITLDADGSTDPGEIPAFVGALMAGADFVKGSRFVQGGKTEDMEWYRRLGNWGLVKFVRLAFGGRFTDLCYGYNAFWRDLLPLICHADAVGFEIETSMNISALQSGLNVAEVPSTEYRRLHGQSNLRTIPDGWRVLSTIVRLRTSKVNDYRDRSDRRRPPLAYDGAFMGRLPSQEPRQGLISK